MPDFKDPVPHTGGTLRIRKRGQGYALEYVHMNFNRAGLVELIAVDGAPVAYAPVAALGLGKRSGPELLTMLTTDAEGMYGRRCPECHSYFRSQHPFTRFCPYCHAEREGLAFLTQE